MKELFKVGDRVICSAANSVDNKRNPLATITGVTSTCYFLDFDDGYKRMTRMFPASSLRKLTKLEKALK